MVVNQTQGAASGEGRTTCRPVARALGRGRHTLRHLVAAGAGALALTCVCAPAGAQVAGQAPAPAQAAKPHCEIPKDLARFNAPLPNLTQNVATLNGIHIIALGSSSTAGSGASNQLASYPARLDAELDRRFPRKDFIVTNYGTGGQLAADMLIRIREDVLSQKPGLVIWQTGVNDAVQDVGVEQFQETLERGVRDLKRAGIDVILVDMQFYPRSERVAVYGDYLKAMRTVANEQNVPLFGRFAIMKHLVKSGQYTSSQLLAPDNFHLNDLSYGCLADLLADAIEEQVKAGIRTSFGSPAVMR
jgi:acyl-CoA thioesterase I